jgi:hypothetical protein
MSGSSKPFWDSAPEDALFLAQDLDGLWDWYTKKPCADDGLASWVNAADGSSVEATEFTPNPLWKTTLERKP